MLPIFEYCDQSDHTDLNILQATFNFQEFVSVF